MKKTKRTPKKPNVMACLLITLKENDNLVMISDHSWYNQDDRSFIINADFHQMHSARDSK